MKLILEKKYAAPVLEVSGKVTTDDAKILRVGLAKLHSGGDQSLILNLTAALIDGNAEAGLMDIHVMALEKGIPLIAVGIKKRFCQASTVKAALDMISKGEESIPAEYILRELFVHLIKKKATIEKELSGQLADAGLEVKAIRNEKLTALVASLENETKEMFRRFANESPSFRDVEEKMAPIRWQLYKLLSEAGILS